MTFGGLVISEEILENAGNEAIAAVAKALPKECLCVAAMKEVFEKAKRKAGTMSIEIFQPELAEIREGKGSYEAVPANQWAKAMERGGENQNSEGAQIEAMDKLLEDCIKRFRDETTGTGLRVLIAEFEELMLARTKLLTQMVIKGQQERQKWFCKKRLVGGR